MYSLQGLTFYCVIINLSFTRHCLSLWLDLRQTRHVLAPFPLFTTFLAFINGHFFSTCPFSSQIQQKALPWYSMQSWPSNCAHRLQSKQCT